jgi:hypothetical protein
MSVPIILLFNAQQINLKDRMSAYLVVTKNERGYRCAYRNSTVDANTLATAPSEFKFDTIKKTLESEYYYVYPDFHNAKKQMQEHWPLIPSVFKVSISAIKNDIFVGFVNGLRAFAVKTISIPNLPLISMGE